MKHTYQELHNKNANFLWNPFTQMKEYLADDPVIIASGQGVKLYDVNGREYWDANSSVWLNAHGHNNASLNQALIDQLHKCAHSTMLGSAHPSAILLAERLVRLSPPTLHKVFYSDNGSTANEVALKLAYSYWRRMGKPKKSKFITMDNAYHGDTIGAVSLGGIDLFHDAFRSLLFEKLRAPYPYTYRYEGSSEECVANSLSKLRDLMQHSNQIAALIVEPMVQGAGGIITMPPGFMSQVAQMCKENDILLVVDEVATGFGRTGTMFACEHENIEPDIMSVGKMLTGGYLPLAATLVSDAIYDAFYGELSEHKAFYHGHSYTGNPLGCAVALANLDLYEKLGTLSLVQKNADWLSGALQELNSLSHVGEVRHIGMIVGIELVKDKSTKQAYDSSLNMGYYVCRKARELGLLTRPLNDVITFVPPLCTSQTELEQMLNIIIRSIDEVTNIEKSKSEKSYCYSN